MIRNGSNVIDLDVFRAKCPGCGASFINHGARKYCSNECRDQWHRDQKKKAYRKSAESYQKPEVLKTCVDCDKEFLTKHLGKKYCSECVAIRRAGKHPVQCIDCGINFLTSGNSAKRCGKCRIQNESLRRARTRDRIATARLLGERPQLHQSAKTGAIAEHMFDILCVRMGWLATRPTVDCNPGWDRIVEFPSLGLLRVQIKGVRPSRQLKYRSKIWRMFRTENPISVQSVDVVAIVDVETSDIWTIPACEAARGSCFDAECWTYLSALGVDGDRDEPVDDFIRQCLPITHS